MAQPNEVTQGSVIHSSMSRRRGLRSEECDLCHCVISACHYGSRGFLHRLVIFSRPSVLSRQQARVWLFLRGLRGLYRVQPGPPVACQRTEVVCVPLKVDTFQIVLHFKANVCHLIWVTLSVCICRRYLVE